MPFKGFNSILFDFDAVIDRELSLVNWMRHVYRDRNLPNIDKHRLLCTSMDDMKFYRVYGYFGEDYFKSLNTNASYKERYREIMKKFYDEKSEDILQSKYVVTTSCLDLIKAYKVAADNAVKTTVRCSDEAEAELIKELCNGNTNILIQDRRSVNTDDYGRIIVGYYGDMLNYNVRLPKSIVILDFRENMTDDDMTALQPELIINFGDIHDIDVMSSYKSIDQSNLKG